MREARSVLFGRTLARARLALAAGRGIGTLALCGGAGLLAGAIGAKGFGTAAPWIPAALAVLLWRLRAAVPSSAECARALDRRHGTGEVASSALVARTPVGELCLRRAGERFGPKEVATLALPTAPPLAAAGLAACAALALLSLGPAGADRGDVSEDLAAVEAFGAAFGAEGRPEGAELARKAAAARRALSRDLEASKEEIESLARKALLLAEERRIREGEAPGTKEARSAAGRLLAVAGERDGRSPGGAGAATSGRGGTSGSGPDRPAGRTSFLAVDVPFEYREVVARYFERGD